VISNRNWTGRVLAAIVDLLTRSLILPVAKNTGKILVGPTTAPSQWFEVSGSVISVSELTRRFGPTTALDCVEHHGRVASTVRVFEVTLATTHSAG